MDLPGKEGAALGWWKDLWTPTPYALRNGRRLFWSLLAAGLAMAVWALADFGGDLEALERAGLGLAGLGLLAGAGSTLALSYGPAEDDVYPFRVLSRVGFLLVGPGMVLSELPGLLRDFDWWVSLLGCAATVVPFGLSLGKLIWKHERGGSRPSKEE